MRSTIFAGLVAVGTLTTSTATAQDFQELSNFAQSICGEIPTGEFSKTTISGKLEANAPLLAKILSGSANLNGEQVKEIYRGIPVDKLPESIPTVSMCKLELIKVLDLRRKVKFVACERPEFGQVGWRRTEDFSNSSGRLGGGHDQPWWCTEVAKSFFASRSIEQPNEWKTVSSREESSRDWKGHVSYKYHCTVRVSWEPQYNRREDPICGTYEQ